MIRDGGADVKVVSPAPREVWRVLADTSDDAVIYQTPDWIDACCQVEGYQDRSRLYEMPDGRRLILPLVSTGRRFGSTLWSLPPNWGQAGILAPDHLTPADVAAITADLRRLHARTIIKPAPTAAAEAWNGVQARARLPYTVHIVDLRSGFDQLWRQRLPASTRSKVRRAEKAGVTIDWDGTGKHVQVAWDLYLRWAMTRAEKQGVPQHIAVARAQQRESLEQFRAVATGLADRCRVALASVDGEPIAFVTMLVHGKHAHYWRGYSDPTLTRGRYPNQLLLVRLIEEAGKAGCCYVHLGKSGGVRSLEEFKESVGGDPHRFEEFRFETSMVAAATRLWSLSRRTLTRSARVLARARRGVTPG